MAGPNTPVTCLLEQPGGKLLAGGGFTAVSSRGTGPLTRLNADGTPDLSFSNPLLSGWSYFSLTMVPAGVTGFVAAGQFGSIQGTSRHNIARFSADGQLDTAYQPGNLEVNTPVSALARQPDGKIVLATAESFSTTAPPFLLARIKTDGTRDAAFTNGLAGVARNIYSLAVLPDGKLLAAGEAISPANTLLLKRLNADGTLDAAFPVPAITGVRIRALAVQPDGGVLFGGNFTWSSGAHANLGRLNPNGTLDTGFLNGQSGMEQNPLISGTSPTVQTLLVQNDGKIVAGGIGFNKVNSAVRTNLALLHGDAPDISIEQPSGNSLTHDTGPAVDFGPVPGGETASLVFTLRNTGNLPLSAPALSFSAESPPHHFSLVTPLMGDLPPGAISTFTVTFTPAGQGVFTTLLEITSNDPDESPSSSASPAPKPRCWTSGAASTSAPSPIPAPPQTLRILTATAPSIYWSLPFAPIPTPNPFPRCASKPAPPRSSSSTRATRTARRPFVMMSNGPPRYLRLAVPRTRDGHRRSGRYPNPPPRITSRNAGTKIPSSPRQETSLKAQASNGLH